MTDADVQYFRSVLGNNNVLTDSDDVAAFNTDWTGHYIGKSRLVLRPGSTAEVVAAIAHCFARNLTVVPQGGNTGLVGGATPRDDEIIISMSRMSRVVKFDENSGALVVEAGAILGVVESYLNERGWSVPLDLGAKGSCQIGGNISTNAGGLRFMRYGSLRGSVLGLEIVLANGTILDMLSTLRKDNVGYDMKQLFIGSEGTLGIVTQVALQAVPNLRSRHVAMFAVQTYNDVLKLVAEARRCCGEILSAVEFLDSAAMTVALEGAPGSPKSTMPPLQANGAPFPFYVLIETRGAIESHDAEKLDTLVEAVAIGPTGIAVDGVVAQDARQALSLWSLREGVTPALAKRGHVFKYDFSFPLPRMLDIVEKARQRVSPWAHHGVVAVGYGHLADGNVHLNVSAPRLAGDTAIPYLPALADALEPWVFEETLASGGSVSAEHGLGQSKSIWLPRSRPRAVQDLHLSLKRHLDPTGILNPCKVTGHITY